MFLCVCVCLHKEFLLSMGVCKDDCDGRGSVFVCVCVCVGGGGGGFVQGILIEYGSV